MRKVFLLAVSVVFLTTIYGCATTEQSIRARGLTPLTQKDLEERFSKPVKIQFDNNVGGRGTAMYAPDGTARVEWPGGGDTGRWQVKDGKICIKWVKIRNGEESCFTSYKTGPKEHMSFAADGTLNAKTIDLD